jgi:Uma2 family endonuclease
MVFVPSPMTRSVDAVGGSANVALGRKACYVLIMDTALRIPSEMDLREFLAWDAPAGARWQLLDGEPRAMSPASRTHGRIQTRLGGLIDVHLSARGSPCTVITTPGVVPRVRSDNNFRIPDLGVTCTGYEREEITLTDPVLLIEILSPSNQAETWSNVWAYTTIPSVQEILIVHSTAVRADLLRRDEAGNWPEQAVTIEVGVLELRSIGFTTDLSAIYQGTRLTQG